MKNQMQTSLRISIAAGLAAATVILSAAEPSRPGGRQSNPRSFIPRNRPTGS